jgi:hypothetical protein
VCACVRACVREWVVAWSCVCVCVRVWEGGGGGGRGGAGLVLCRRVTWASRKGWRLAATPTMGAHPQATSVVFTAGRSAIVKNAMGAQKAFFLLCEMCAIEKCLPFVKECGGCVASLGRASVCA